MYVFINIAITKSFFCTNKQVKDTKDEAFKKKNSKKQQIKYMFYPQPCACSWSRCSSVRCMYFLSGVVELENKCKS